MSYHRCLALDLTLDKTGDIKVAAGKSDPNFMLHKIKLLLLTETGKFRIFPH